MPAAKRILCIDVGGTGLKAAIFSPKGKYLVKRVRVKTPKDRRPRQIVAALAGLVVPLGRFDHVTIGFPGVVKDGKVVSAPHFGTKDWKGFPLAAAMHVLIIRVVVPAIHQAQGRGDKSPSSELRGRAAAE